MFQSSSRSSKRGQANSPKAPPNYLSRREQMRLLVLVGSLMLVIILMIKPYGLFGTEEIERV